MTYTKMKNTETLTDVSKEIDIEMQKKLSSWS
jgi:hypothetical protein